MSVTSYKVEEFRRLIKEGSNEFKAKVGDGVESDDKKNSKEFYNDAIKETGAKEEKPKHNVPEKEDGNKTTLDYKFDGDPGKDYKKRVHIQAQGYTSELEKKNGIEKDPSLEFGEDFYKQAKDAGKKISDAEKALKKSGLQAREWPGWTFDKEGVYENKKMKTVRFKHTTFLSEGHMLSKVPDDFKVDGNTFKMKDQNDNTYMVEWKEGKGEVLSHENKKAINEEISRIKSLFAYKSSDYFNGTSAQNRVNESNDAFKSTIKRARNILITETDSRLNVVDRIIQAEFGSKLDPNGIVNSEKYQVNGNPNTRWKDYLLYSLRHTFGMMNNSDAKYLPLLAKIAFSDEVGFEKRNDNGAQVAALTKIFNLIKTDDSLFEKAKSMNTYTEMCNFFSKAIGSNSGMM